MRIATNDTVTEPPPAVRVEGLSKTYGRTAALRDVSLSVEAGEMVALLGASGSGKSTLIRHIAGLRQGDAGDGRVAVFGREVQRGGRLARDVRAARGGIGVVFQQFNLVTRSTVLTNVLAGALHRTPAWRGLLHVFPAAERRAALAALDEVGMVEYAYRRAADLSGGQQQRVAIARALMQRARLILADEPIASLDPESARRVMELLARIHREQGVTVLVSLHQVEHALRHCPRIVALRAGAIVYDGPAADLTAQRLRELYGAEAEALAADEPGASRSGGSLVEPAALHATGTHVDPAAAFAQAA
jgi:phosphonate transport system ATP-binding protein